MKKIDIIIPINNPDCFSQADFDAYASENCQYRLKYINTHLKELNNAEDAAMVVQPTIDCVLDSEKSGTDAIIIFAFGDVAVRESAQAARIPVMGCGTYSMHVASEIAATRFTILPGKIEHNTFIEFFINQLGLSKKFILSDIEVGMYPSEIRNDKPMAIDNLFKAACHMIDKHQIEAFSMGCTSFFGMAKPLREKLKTHYGSKKTVLVVDPGEIALSVAQAMV